MIADFWSSASPYLFWPLIVLGTVLFIIILLKFCRVYVGISSNEFGVIEKTWSRKGSIKSGFISLDGRAGFQPDTLRAGPHFFLPWLYRIHKQQLITVRTMAYVYARDGLQLPAGQALAHTPEGITFDNVRAFLENGGQRGIQRGILREGIYAINTAAFVVFTDDRVHALDVGNDTESLSQIARTIQERDGFSPVVLRGKDDYVGVVTVHDGPALDPDDIIAPRVGTDSPGMSHNSYQDIEAFLRAGGRRGRQEQVMTEGTFFINRMFATVEFMPKTIIDVGTVGVVVSYIGSKGEDLSGDTYTHGELVGEGHRGVLKEPYRPGKYAINPYARKIDPVPTTNFVLRWIEGRVEDHGYDSSLSEIPLITMDAFQPMLPLSVVVHIAPNKAPRVIQRFAGVKLLVDQTIDPMISAFFKDVAQKYTLVDLIGKRDLLQREALEKMKARFAAYDLDLLEVMIGTPRAAMNDTAIPNILEQLRQRQVAVEQETTFVNQQKAADARRLLNEATAKAENQAMLTASEIEIIINGNKGQADLKRAEQSALATRATGQAEAEVIRAKGLAQAEATEAQAKAFTGEGADFTFRRTVAEEFAKAIINAKMPIVPQIVVHGGGGTGQQNGSTSIIDAMSAMLMKQMAAQNSPLANGHDTSTM